jgi:hypothetical protein
VSKHVLINAKAYAALVGTALTAVISSLDTVPVWLKVASAVATAVATWKIPNADASEF